MLMLITIKILTCKTKPNPYFKLFNSTSDFTAWQVILLMATKAPLSYKCKIHILNVDTGKYVL